MATNYSPSIVTDGLVCALDAADRNSYPYPDLHPSGSNWYDLRQGGFRGQGFPFDDPGLNFATDNDQGAAGANTGSFVNEHGGGLHFTGSHDNFLVGHRAFADNIGGVTFGGASANFTYEVWVKFNQGDAVGGGGHIIGNNARADGLLRGANGNGSHISIDGSGNLKVFTFNGGGDSDYDTGFDMAVGELAQVGMVHTAETSKAGFKNGVLGASQARWSTQNFAYMTLLGEHNEGSFFTQMDFPNMTLYAVRIYNRVLSAEEIQRNYKAQRSRFGV